MEITRVVLFLAGLAMVSCVLVEWTAEEYGNPIEDPVSCGRTEPSFVCDPNGMLTRKAADDLDQILWSFPNNTTCPCSTYSCEMGSRKGQLGRGYKMAVALVKRLKRPEGVANTVEGKTSLAMTFAFDLLHKHWLIGTCDELVIVVFSKDDGILLTFPGTTAGNLLTEQQTKKIQQQFSRFFRIDNKIGVGLQYISMNYRRVLDGFGHYPIMYTHVPSGAAIVQVSIVTTLISTLLLRWLC